ncbi:alpha-ketoacid dehydrogenase subunit beta [SAR202 cluster bacterium AD-804-J14_MRT_500m]|nr:alpha-ketoacid dehydrogenase subunit beta [SAR202 cluster bacterium AD-804-J14_MRT_500m]
MAVKSVIESIRDTISEEMVLDSRIILLGEDVGARGGVFLATQGFEEQFGDDRIIDTPLAEESIAGIGVGLAFKGLRPIIEIQFSDFWWYACNQIVGEASRVFYGSNGKLPVPMVVRIPYGGGIRGGLFHSQSIEGYLFNTPGLKVVAPSNPYDAKGLLKSAIRDNNPVIFLEHKRTYRAVRGEVPDNDYLIPIGTADVKRPGSDITIISYGLVLHYALEAATILENEGISVEVVDLRSLLPLDHQTIINSAKKTGKVLIVHEDNVTGGVGSEISAIISENAFEFLDAPIRRLGGPDIPAVPFAPTLENAYMLNPDKIAVALRELGAY